MQHNYALPFDLKIALPLNNTSIVDVFDSFLIVIGLRGKRSSASLYGPGGLVMGSKEWNSSHWWRHLHNNGIDAYLRWILRPVSVGANSGGEQPGHAPKLRSCSTKNNQKMKGGGTNKEMQGKWVPRDQVYTIAYQHISFTTTLAYVAKVGLKPIHWDLNHVTKCNRAQLKRVRLTDPRTSARRTANWR